MFEEFLAGASDADRPVLQAVVDRVAAVAPTATEGRSYGLPAFRYKDKPLVGLAIAKKHLSLFPFSATVVAALQPQLSDFDVSKGTIRFTAEHPIPDDLLTAIATARMQEIDGG
jgi:uncharacterized protein YdhG (YjbR/CyaY superfamily)